MSSSLAAALGLMFFTFSSKWLQTVVVGSAGPEKGVAAIRQKESSRPVESSCLTPSMFSTSANLERLGFSMLLASSPWKEAESQEARRRSLNWVSNS